MTEVNRVLQNQAPGPELGGDAKASGSSLGMKQYGGARAGGRELGTEQGAAAGGVWNWPAEQCREVAGALELESRAGEGTAKEPELGAGDQNWRQQGVQSWGES